MKKILSLMLTLTFIIIQIPIAKADATLQVKYWNMDRNVITIDFSEEVNLDTLNNNVIVKQNGTPIAVSFSKSITGTVLEKGTTALPTETANTILITPSESFKLNTPYDLILQTAITNKAGTNNLSETFSKILGVEAIFSDDFASYNDTNNPISAVWTANHAGSMTVENGKMKAVTAKDDWQMVIQPKDIANQLTWTNYTFEFDFNVQSTGGFYIMMHNTGGIYYSGSKYRVALKTDGNKIVWLRDTLDGAESTKVFLLNSTVGITANADHKFKMIVKNGNIKVYIDGVKLFEYNDNSIPAGSIGFGNNGTVATIHYLDNILLTKTIEYLDVQTTPATGEMNVPINSNILINFPKEVDATTITNSNIFVKSGNTVVSGSDVSLMADGKTVNVSFQNPLSYKTEYTIEISKDVKLLNDSNIYSFVKHTFQTSPPPFDLDSFIVTENGKVIKSLSDLTGKSFTATAAMKNNAMVDPQSCMLTIALFNGDGQLCGIQGKKITLPLGEAEIVNANFSIEGITGASVVCFVWDSFGSMKHLYEQQVK